MSEDYLGQKLSIFIGKNDKYEGIVLYELLLEIAFNSRLSGGTVTIGDKGFFGAQDETRKMKVLRSSENLPVVLEFVGRAERIKRYIERIQPMIKEGLLTRADVIITKFNAVEEIRPKVHQHENQDQSQIFEKGEDGSDSPDPQHPEQDFTSDNNMDETNTPEPELPGDTFKSLEEEPTSNTAEFLETEQEQELEQDDHDVTEPVLESFALLDEDEEDAPPLQLTDQSETPSDDELSTTPPEMPKEQSESSEPKMQAPEEEVFDEDEEEVEVDFDQTIKQSDQETGVETDTDSEEEEPLKQNNGESQKEEQGETPPADEDEIDNPNPKKYDKNHTEEDMKNYFSSLFKK